MTKNQGFGGDPFRLGLFASVPLRKPLPQGTIAVPYTTMLFNVYNKYLPQYWPPYIPVEPAPQGVPMRMGRPNRRR